MKQKQIFISRDILLPYLGYSINNDSCQITVFDENLFRLSLDNFISWLDPKNAEKAYIKTTSRWSSTDIALFWRLASQNEKIRDFDGIVIGISAGTMNAADVVYVQPELPGEAINPEFKREAVGLGLTKVNILPHYQMVKDWMLDGMRLFEEITYGDSWGKEFLALCDGSYLFCENGKELVIGEAYLITNGKKYQVCWENQARVWKG